VSGIGGSLGPELTRIGLKRGQGYLAAAISHPGKSKPVDTNGFYQFLVVRVELKNGKTIEGIRINEDTFSIQLKDHSNHLYSFKKEQILSIEKIKDFSLMPSFIDQFSDSEINDIVAYLTSLE
jgi:putative heme-binding domain-containing protein